MPRGNKDFGKYGKGRPKGSKNKTPILLEEFETVIFELPKKERLKRLRAYRDYHTKGNPHANYVKLHTEIAKRQEASTQGDIFDWNEEQQLIKEAEAIAHGYTDN
ncbi:MAG TPA: hypothetical protein ENH40_05355 [Nitrospirae bacterium]|nr:hypothetical protein [Nitrospirota bacterium]